MTNLQALPLILITVGLNTLAQLFLKLGMRTVGYFEFSAANLLPIALQVSRNPYIIGGIACYVFSLAFWMMVLSRVEVSFAYPFMSLGFIFTALAGYYFIQEDFTLSRLLGIVVIIIGVFLVARS